ncbi:TadE/TadG family type IV pilus assembly protein [Geomonas edaphica]|uniref:TadE/TadG family type IV pilus assembly protein n=1 Tax=Geomonas edaphica TaxID=2570226 RepID=UPI0010A91108|nr:TadE/TadG family type IV pilus assembly protein [Geomonas edaphica]
MRPGGSWNRARGQACVELALLLLVFGLVLLAIYDFSCAIRANTVISNVSREGANLAARPAPGTLPDLQGIMDLLAATAQPLDMAQRGMMYITEVQGDTIQAQEAWNKGALRVDSRIGTYTPGGAHPQALGLDALKLGNGERVFVVEVFYEYRSLFSGSMVTLDKQFYARTVF